MTKQEISRFVAQSTPRCGVVQKYGDVTPMGERGAL